MTRRRLLPIGLALLSTVACSNPAPQGASASASARPSGSSARSSDSPAPRASSAQSAASATVASNTASAPAPEAPISPEIAARIGAFEAGLLPSLTLTGVDLAQRLEPRMVHYKVPAFGVAVIEDGKVQWAKSYGLRARGGAGAVDRDTLFQAASISKPVTAVAVLRLVQAGKLDLDADVNTYLTSWKVPTTAKKTTLRALLSHTAGVSAPEQTAYFDPSGGFRGYKPTDPLPTTAQILKGEKPAISEAIEVATPDKPVFAYSGGGYTIIQQVVEDVTGQSFADAMKTWVLDPAGMTRSTFATTPPDDDYARAHTREGDPAEGGYVVVVEKAAGGLWTTPSDLALFVAELMAAYQGKSDKLLKQDTAKLMLTAVADARPRIAGSIGLGMFVSDDPGDLWFSHNGHNPGFHGTIAAVPALGKGVVMMVNREDGAGLIGEATYGLGALYDWPARTGVRSREKPTATIAAEDAAALKGSFEGGGLLAPSLKVKLRTDGLAVYATLDDQPEARVYPISKTDFVEPFAPAILRFKVDKGRATSVLLDSPLGKREADRSGD
ncbi:MAG: serine hydrolase domain-containing protein [Polyangiaceae bacterium]